MVKEYIKKPKVVKAIQYLREENISKVQSFVGEDLYYNPEDNEYYIRTLEGDHKCTKYDYIIRGIKGEFYPCKPDIFLESYEEFSCDKEEA